MKTKGFTLIEALVYIALLTVMFLGVVKTLTLLSTSYRKVEAVRSLETSAIISMDRILRVTKDATSIDTAQSSFNVSSGVLALNGLDANSTPVSISFSLSGGRIMLAENGVNLGPLTTGDTNVTSLIFRQYSTTTSSAVKVEMIMTNASSAPFSTTRNFYGTAVLRGSY